MDLEFDLSDCQRAFREGQAHLLRVAREAPMEAAIEGQNQAIARRRYKDRTGILTGRAYVRPTVPTADGGAAEMVWPVRYASFVDAGTPAHEIRPKRRAFLRFGDAASPIFARAVRHPGTKPTGFAGDAATIAERVLIREIEVGFRELATILSR